MSVYVFSKLPAQDTDVQQDFSSLLTTGETLSSMSVAAPTPSTTPALTVTKISAPTSAVFKATLKGGVDATAYAINITCVTSTRTFVIETVVNVRDNMVAYPTNTGAYLYRDLIDVLDAGGSAIGVAMFSLPFGSDANKGSVTWDLIDDHGNTYASGTAFNYTVRQDTQSMVFAKCLINAPDNTPPSSIDTRYQIQYTLTLPDVKTSTTTQGTVTTTTTTTTTTDTEYTPQTVFYVYENVVISGGETVPLGATSSVELVGDQARPTIVLDQPYDTVILEVASNNTVLYSQTVTDVVRVASGFIYTGTVETANLTASLIPYTLSWKYSSANTRAAPSRETGELYVATYSILQAIDDVQARLSKARTVLYGGSVLLFPPEVVMKWMRRGGDMFNAARGAFTEFTFTNALGAIREYWLLCTEVAALEAQYLAEGAKAFEFADGNVTLTVDQTQFIDGLIAKLQGRLDNELHGVKKNLIIRGVTGGDGSMSTVSNNGAVASVKVAVTAVNNITPVFGGVWR